jgi:hypothetical protein
MLCECEEEIELHLEDQGNFTEKVTFELGLKICRNF